MDRGREGAGVGLLAAYYGFKLCLLNRTLTTPGLEINLAWLYASSVVGGRPTRSRLSRRSSVRLSASSDGPIPFATSA